MDVGVSSAMFRNRSLEDLTERLTRLEDNYLSNIPRVATLESRINVVDKHLLSLESRWDKQLKASRHEEDFYFPAIDAHEDSDKSTMGGLTAGMAEGAPMFTEASPAQAPPAPMPSLPPASAPAGAPSQ